MTSTLAVLANDALLLLAAAIWGFAFVAQRAGMEHIGPLTYNAIRFALGALALLPLVLARRQAARRAEVRAAAAAASGPRRIHPLPAGLLAGAGLTGGAILQQAGMVSTTAGKAGFAAAYTWCWSRWRACSGASGPAGRAGSAWSWPLPACIS
jgi:drug/metabolite transporter (DMT)-like permease